MWFPKKVKSHSIVLTNLTEQKRKMMQSLMYGTKYNKMAKYYT